MYNAVRIRADNKYFARSTPFHIAEWKPVVIRNLEHVTRTTGSESHTQHMRAFLFVSRVTIKGAGIKRKRDQLSLRDVGRTKSTIPMIPPYRSHFHSFIRVTFIRTALYTFFSKNYEMPGHFSNSSC